MNQSQIFLITFLDHPSPPPVRKLGVLLGEPWKAL